jgi:DNA invertase Pin-like site-specific DNA recombinase
VAKSQTSKLDDRDKLILAGIKAGLCRAQIARAIGCTRMTVHRRYERIKAIAAR